MGVLLLLLLLLLLPPPGRNPPAQLRSPCASCSLCCKPLSTPKDPPRPAKLTLCILLPLLLLSRTKAPPPLLTPPPGTHAL